MDRFIVWWKPLLLATWTGQDCLKNCIVHCRYIEVENCKSMFEHHWGSYRLTPNMPWAKMITHGIRESQNYLRNGLSDKDWTLTIKLDQACGVHTTFGPNQLVLHTAYYILRNSFLYVYIYIYIYIYSRLLVSSHEWAMGCSGRRVQ